jgi:hypothetical protein
LALETILAGLRLILADRLALEAVLAGLHLIHADRFAYETVFAGLHLIPADRFALETVQHRAASERSEGPRQQFRPGQRFAKKDKRQVLTPMGFPKNNAARIGQ